MEVEENLGSTQLKQILDSFEAGDVLPEVCTQQYNLTPTCCLTPQADIVCNIVDKLGKNIVICSCLLQYCSLSQVLERSVLPQNPLKQHIQDEILNHFLTVRRDNHSASLNSALQVNLELWIVFHFTFTFTSDYDKFIPRVDPR